MKSTFRVNARIDEAENIEGYNVHDYFDIDLNDTYSTRAEAHAAALNGYKGEDSDGIGCSWEIVEDPVA